MLKTTFLAEEKVFKDPVHKYIYVKDELIWDLINTKEFQRLRRIRQLGTSYFTFHGAEHSRFSHSLGVYEIMRRMISLFERNDASDWPKGERLLCLCAALLHDIGHGPFSHSLESALSIHHEQWSIQIIRGDTEVNRVLRSAGNDFPDLVASVIEKTYPKEIVVDLISSQMDADRMDYLLRDAYYTGVNYGTFDLERILRMLRPHRGRIVVKESGMHAVEDYLMARYQMYWQVYFHPVTRSSEIILRKIFDRAKALYEDGYAFGFLISPLSQMFEGKMAVEQYLQLDESLIQFVFSRWTSESDPVLADLCARFVHRRLFKYVSMDELNRPLIESLKEYAVKMGIDPEYYIEIDFPSDLPYDVYRPGEASGKLPILLLTDDDRLVEISERSDVVMSITGIRKGRHHIYYPHDMFADHRESLPKDLVAWLQLDNA